MLEKAQEPNDQLPIWAGASEIATFEEGGNQMDKMFHAHNLKNVINSNKNSIIDRFSPIIKIIYVPLISYV